jgi:hypothetical protein
MKKKIASLRPIAQRIEIVSASLRTTIIFVARCAINTPAIGCFFMKKRNNKLNPGAGCNGQREKKPANS